MNVHEDTEIGNLSKILNGKGVDNMFEKEAEEYVDLSGNRNYTERAFKDGAEFGYNKANEWHYVKDELPEKEKYVLVYTKLENVYMARLVKDNYFINNKGGFVQTSSVIAWKEIVLPELKGE